MPKLVNRAKMTTATTGTGTITLGSAVDGYQTFVDAGVLDGDILRYVIEDGISWEIGTGTYSSGTLTRSPSESSNSDSAINLTGAATAFVTATAEDFSASGVPGTLDYGLITEPVADGVFEAVTLVTLTQAAYDALGTYDNNTLYVVSG